MDFQEKCVNEMLDHLFHKGLESKLPKDLAKIEGIRSLKISPNPQSKKAIKAFTGLKARMEDNNSYKLITAQPPCPRQRDRLAVWYKHNGSHQGAAGAGSPCSQYQTRIIRDQGYSRRHQKPPGQSVKSDGGQLGNVHAVHIVMEGVML